MPDPTEFSGRCYCGSLRYKAGGPVQLKAQCHCRECQYISGGGPNYFMILPAASFEWTKGTPQTFARSDLENPVTRCFCGTCGTHILTELTDGERVVLKVGTLNDPLVYGGPKIAIYTCDEQPFHVTPGNIARFDKLP